MTFKRTLAMLAGAGAAVLLAACGNATPITSGTPSPAPTITPYVSLELKIPTAASQPGGITSGLDNGLWFTETAADKIGHINTLAVVTEFAVPTANAMPLMIATGSDSALWFTESGVPQIGRVPVNGGAMTEFNLQMAAARPWGIVNGPDGALWATDPGANGIWRITTAGVPTFYPLTTAGAQPTAIIAANNGALWFLEKGANKIGTIAPGAPGEAAPAFTPPPGYVAPTEYPVAAGAGLGAIVQGNDNALWFTESNAGKLGRMLTNGSGYSELALPGVTKPVGIALGHDNNFYIADMTGNAIVQYKTLTGGVSIVTIPTANSGAFWVTLGPDLEIYFTEQAANHVAQFRYF